MTVLKTLTLALGLGVLVASCGGETAPKKEEAPKAEPETAKAEPEAKPEMAGPWSMTKDGLTVTEKTSAPEYPGATLTLNTPAEGAAVTAGANQFNFAVTPGENDYQLGNQTQGAGANGCANSAKGQHIHFIVNNAPYKAHYTPEFEGEMSEGNNVVLAFISRSYHESIKSEGAFVVTQFNTGSGEAADLGAKHLFYSRPKGSYTGEFAKSVLLDFFPVNTTLAADGDKVKVTINGSTEFVLPKWTPYTIEGLPMGENTVQIELIDAEGNAIAGPFNNSGPRTFTLKAEEPAN